jgi:4'-phosphopantetheinyl transferase
MKNTLIDQEIHIYLIDSRKINIPEKAIIQCLTEEEIFRADKFKCSIDKRLFLLSRYYLKNFIGEYLNLSPEKIKISQSKSGKPYLNDKINSNLKFNYSHSGDYIIYAFTTDNEIGVDIEEIKDISEIDELSRTHFSDEELSIYFELENPDEKKQLFYKIWTRKEALLKAEGSGITIDLKSLTVLTTNEKKSNQIKVKFLNQEWSVSDLFIDVNYASSVAINSDSCKEIFVFDEDFNLLKKI